MYVMHASFNFVDRKNKINPTPLILGEKLALPILAMETDIWLGVIQTPSLPSLEKLDIYWGGSRMALWRMARSKVLLNQSIDSTGTFGKSNVFRHRSNSQQWNIIFYHGRWLLQMTQSKNTAIEYKGLDTSKVSYEVSRSIGIQILRILRTL